jgi:hypothetical protein
MAGVVTIIDGNLPPCLAKDEEPISGNSSNGWQREGRNERL